MDVNITNASVLAAAADESALAPIPSFKRSVTAGAKLPVLRSGKRSVVTLEGRENAVSLSGSVLGRQSSGRRRSPRTQ